jgi:PKD repeat protein
LKNFTTFKKKYLLACLMIAPGFSAFSQSSQVVSRGHEQQSVIINFAEIAAREAANPPEIDYKKLIIHEDEGDIPDNFYGADGPETFYADPINQVRSTPPQVLPPVHNFQGLIDINGGIPPDVGGCAGPNHIMEVLNTQVRVYNKNGTGANSAVTLNGFWSSLSNPSTFDPRVYYDKYGDRYIFVTLADANTANARILVGVTLTNNPTGTWKLYSIDVDATNANWFDFPNLGYNYKWIVIGGNMFGNISNTFVGSQIYAFDKASMYASGPATYTRFTGNLFTVCPVETMDATEETEYLVQNISSTQVRMYKITGTVGSEVFSTHGTVSGSAWGCTSCSGNFAPQYNSANLIDNGDWRIRSAVFRFGSVWFAQTAFMPATGSNRSVAQWWQLSTASPPTVIQRGRVEDPSANVFYAYPAIAVNGAGDAFLSYTRFAYNEYANAEYAYRLATDAPNTMRDGYRFKLGETTYFKDFGSGRNRWGDYTSASVDPTNDTTFWAVSEYAKIPTNTWGTWWAEVHPRRATFTDFVADTHLVCAGSPVQFTDLSTNSPTSWAWTFAGGTPATSTAQNPSVTFATSGVHSVTLIVNGNDTMVKNNYINVLAVPPTTVTVGGATTFCQGGSVTLSGTVAATSWLWFPTGQTTRTITVTTSGTYYVIATNAAGCSTTSVSTVVTVNPLPSVSLSLPTNYFCDTVTSYPLSGGNPPGGTYSGTAVTGNIFNPSAAGDGNFTITYTYTDGNNCTSSATQGITVGSNCFVGVPGVSADYTFSVNPNPAHSSIEINFIPKSATALTVNLSNELGQQVFNKAVPRTESYKETVDVSKLPAGIYFLTINTDKESAKVRVIIE